MKRRQARNTKMQAVALTALLFSLATVVLAEDGYRLWLRYEPLPSGARPTIAAIVAAGDSATAKAVRDELVAGCSGLLGRTIAVAERVEQDGTIVVGTPKSSPLIAGLKLPLTTLGNEGFVIRSAKLNGRSVIAIAANTEVGALYGAFHFLRLLQAQQPIFPLNISQKPRLQLRMLNHWDNLDGSIERGYAGRSLWNWSELPDKVDPRLRDYARANASLGINATALNNVNANAKSLNAEYLRKTAAIAAVCRGGPSRCPRLPAPSGAPRPPPARRGAPPATRHPPATAAPAPRGRGRCAPSGRSSRRPCASAWLRTRACRCRAIRSGRRGCAPK